MNVFLLGVLFAITGALCGILVTKTYSGANFVPVSGCSVVGSSIVPAGGGCLSETFDDQNAFDQMFSKKSFGVNDAADIASSPGKLMCLLNTATDWQPSAQTPVVELIPSASSDFEVTIDWSREDVHAYVGFRVVFLVDYSNYIQIKWFYSTGTYILDIDWKESGNLTQSRYYVNEYLAGQLKAKRAGDMWSVWHRATSSDSWTSLISAQPHAIGSSVKLQLGAFNLQATPNVKVCFDNLVFLSGGPPAPYSDAVFTITDPGKQTINTEYPYAFDKATFGVTTTNSPTLSFRTSDQDADGAPSWSSSKTLAQLIAEANSGKQFMAIEVTASKSGLSYQFDQLQVSTYNLDVTPPEVPAIDWISSINGQRGFALSITEPPDADYSHCEIAIKLNDGSFQTIDDSFGLGGSTPMKFTSSVVSPQPAGQINVAQLARWGYQVGDIVTARCRSVDGSGNTSAWVTSSPLTIPGDVPITPTITSVTAGINKNTIAAAVTNGLTYYLYFNTTGSVTKQNSERIPITLPYEHTGLDFTETYYYKLSQENEYGESELSNQLSAMPLQDKDTAVPEPPVIASVLPMQEKNYITIQNDLNLPVNLYFSKTELTLNKLMATKIPLTENTFTHEPLDAETYYYAATVTNDNGESDLSAVVSGTPVAEPPIIEYIPYEISEVEVDMTNNEEIVAEIE